MDRDRRHRRGGTASSSSRTPPGPRREYEGRRAGTLGRRRLPSASTPARTSAPTARAARRHHRRCRDCAEIRARCATGARTGKYHHVATASTTAWTASRARSSTSSCRTSTAGPHARRRIANAYDAGLASGRSPAPPPPGADHVYHVYAVRTADRAAMRARLQSEASSTGIHYPTPVHLQKAYAHLGSGEGSLPGQPRGWRARSCRCRSIPELGDPRWPASSTRSSTIVA